MSKKLPRPEQSQCKHCDGLYSVFTCETCKKTIRGVCKECHDEVIHGVITPQFMNPQFGGIDARMDDDGGPWQQNAVRDMEGG